MTNTSTYELTDTITLKNIVGFHRTTSKDKTDVDGSPYEPLTIGNVAGPSAEGYTYVNQQISEELQLSGKALANRLKYIVGVYYYSGLDRQRIPLAVAPDLPSGALASFLREYQTGSDSKAVYGQTTYGVTEKINLTAGVRYTSETTDYRPLLTDASGLAGVKPASNTTAKPSWTVSLDYKPTDEWLLYAANRGSWRTGGFNGTATDTLPNGQLVVNSFKPETTYDFEVGTKFNGRLANIPTTFNLALYNQKISNVIRAIYTGVSAVSGNVKEARVRGIDADFVLRPLPWLQLGGNFAYTDAEYTQNAATVAGRTVLFGPYGDTPRTSGDIYFRISHELPDTSEVAFRADVYRQSKFYYSNAANTILPGTEIPGYHLVNARLEWNEIGGTGASAAVWAKNLTDAHTLVGGFALGAVNAINAVLPGLPRTFGIEITDKF